MSTWPDPSATVPTTDLDNDTDNLAAARVDLLDAVQKLNQILGTCTIASTPWTDLNDATLQKRITSGTTNGIVLEDASGDVITSGKTISTSVGSTDATVPTGKAVQTYVADNGGFTYSNELTLTLSADGQVSLLHGLGQSPDMIVSYLRCNTADNGYDVGDRIFFGGSMFTADVSKGVAGFGAISVYGDSLRLHIANKEPSADNWTVSDADGLSVIQLTRTSWTICARAYVLT